MNLVEFRERIARGEDLHTDFKERLDSKEELAKDLVCFANTDGGRIILGVRKDRTPVGVEEPDKVVNAVDDVAFNRCEPPVTVVQEILQDGGRAMVVINIPKGDQRPYRTHSGQFYIRSAARCRQASREELLRLFQATESFYYDETPMPRLGLGDLDLDAFQKFLEATGQASLAVEPGRLLRSWRLLAGAHPTVAGVLLFGRDPQRHIPYAQINAARIPGTELAAAPSDRKDLTGRLLDVIADAQRFARIHLRIPHEIRGFEPEPRPEMPEEALREALVNAVAHRDYTVRGPVRLFIFDDRVEIHTPGRPPNTVDQEAMRFGVHVVRNPHLYARLSDAGLVTRAGSGIPRIIRLLKDATGKDVEIVLRDFEVLLVLPRKKPQP